VVTLHGDELDASVGPPGATPTRIASPYISTISSVAFAVGDACALAAAAFAAAAFVGIAPQDLGAHAELATALVFTTATWFALFERVGLYRRSYSFALRDELYATLAALALGALPVLIVTTFVPGMRTLRPALFALVAASLITVGGIRAVLHVARTTVGGRRSRKIAVVGSRERVETVLDEFPLNARDAVYRICVEHFDRDVETALAGRSFDALRWLRTAVEWDCTMLLVTEALPPEIMPGLLRLLEERGIMLCFAPTRIRSHAYDVSIVKAGGLALIRPRSLPVCRPGTAALRRAVDVMLVAPAVVLISPLLMSIALAVRLTSRGPVLYRQERVGLHGRTFDVLKFRSMYVDSEDRTGPVWAKSAENRTTPVGRFLRRTSLDELPQLFNVLRGEMALVGPRPERPFYVEQFRRTLPRYEERLLVRPGITGWSHIHMKRDVDVSAIGERLAYDLHYIEQWTPFMDLSILVKTLAEFLFHHAV